MIKKLRTNIRKQKTKEIFKVIKAANLKESFKIDFSTKSLNSKVNIKGNKKKRKVYARIYTSYRRTLLKVATLIKILVSQRTMRSQRVI